MNNFFNVIRILINASKIKGYQIVRSMGFHSLNQKQDMINQSHKHNSFNECLFVGIGLFLNS